MANPIRPEVLTAVRKLRDIARKTKQTDLAGMCAEILDPRDDLSHRKMTLNALTRLIPDLQKILE